MKRFENALRFKQLHMTRVRILLWVAWLSTCQVFPLPAFASARLNELPNHVLWAWERKEDLSKLNPKHYGVAYLACHLFIVGDKVQPKWRDQPLKVASQMKLVPVIRIDVERSPAPKYSEEQIEEITRCILKIASRHQTRAVQIDFDALQTEREFYKDLLQKVRTKLPANLPLSITALASWCLYDDWIKTLPVDETIPMMFSLGTDREKILLYFKTHRDFLVAKCCDSLGVSLEDSEVNRLMIPIAKNRKIPVRIYVFTRTAWTEAKLQAVQTLLGTP